MRRFVPVLSVPLACGLLACTGDIMGEMPAGEGAAPTPGGSQGGSGPGTNGSNGGNTGQMPANSACKTGAPTPVARVWRLSPSQYANTVSQLFGVQVAAGDLPADAVADDGVSQFDTNFEGSLVPERLASVYRDTAARVAESTVSTAMAGNGCLQTQPLPAGCAETFVNATVGKAFRRPLDAEETKRWSEFLKTSASKWDGQVAVRMLMEAVLQSPHFLYRTELGAPADAGKPRAALTQHELASQISYLLADQPPSAALLEAAAAGKLADRDTVRRLAAELVRTPGARAKLSNFFTQLLHVKGLADGSLEKDPTVFSEFTDELKKSMLTETKTFIDKVVWEGQGSLKALYTADHSYVDAALAKHYGLPAPTGAFSKTVLPGAQRKGLLGHAGVLSAISGARATSPSHRGLFFYQTMLCKAVPVPPPDAEAMGGKLISPDTKATQREHWEYSRKAAPECAACHGLFIPMGLSLEKFDAIGRFRATEFDKPIDTTVNVIGQGDVDGTYADGFALAEKIVDSEAGRTCFVQQYLTYGFGRKVDPEAESCELGALADRFAKSGMSIQELLVELTQQDSFYFRRHEN